MRGAVNRPPNEITTLLGEEEADREIQEAHEQIAFPQIENRPNKHRQSFRYLRDSNRANRLRNFVRLGGSVCLEVFESFSLLII